MGNLKKRIRSSEGAASVEQYRYITCAGPAQQYCDMECNISGPNGYAMAIVRQQHEHIFVADYQ